VNASGSSAWSGGRRLAVITGAWCFFAALLTINNYVYPAMMGQPVTWREAARFPFITYAIWTLFTPLILFVCERIRRRHWKPPLWIAAHATFAIVTLLLIAALWLPFAELSTDAGQPARYSWHTVSGLFWQSLAWNLWMYCVIVGIFYGLDYYFTARDARVRAAQLEAQLASAELEILKNQLQPHFLFNTLNLISSLIHTDQASADDMVGDLGALLRMSLESHASHEVSLAEEMKAIELYLNIQRLRFQDTLTIKMHIAPETLEARVPHLILQPIVENAFRHGISKRVGQGLLTIESTQHDGSLRILVSDNGPGANGSAAAPGIGLNNTRSRLEKLYGNRASLDLDSSSSGFIVALEFPFTIVANGTGA
jgi:two-component system, LytTR family, sensor kinase